MTARKLTKKEKASFLASHSSVSYEGDPPECAACGSYDNIIIDHKIPRSQGGRNNNDNLQLLCTSCHGHKTWFDNDSFLISRIIQNSKFENEGCLVSDVVSFLVDLGLVKPKAARRIDLLTGMGLIKNRWGAGGPLV